MITLTVVSYNGQPSDRRLSAQFDELGGTIGRADTNQLVLPDPDRAISRVHAQVVFRNGTFAVADRGSNPIQVNGQAVGSGREQKIAEGDRVQIGGYVLSVAQSAGTARTAGPVDPFADLLGPTAASNARAPGNGAALIDPLAAYGNESNPKTVPSAYTKSAAPAAAPAMGIPDDWDPFAPDPVRAPSSQPLGQSLGRTGNSGGNFGLDVGTGAAAPLISGLGSGAPESSLDQLFGLKASTGGDPFANSLLDAPMAKPNMAANADPLASLGSVPKASAQAVQDDFSLLNQPFQAPPLSRPLMPPAAPSFAPPAAPPLESPIPAGAVLSWDTGSDPDSTHTVIRASAPRAPVAAPAAPLTPLTPFTPAASPVPAHLAPQPRPPAALDEPVKGPVAGPAVNHSDSAALLDALRSGLAVPGLQIDRLTPELMLLIGQLLHEAASGTTDLLVARAAMKREVRAEATMIVARENNPLKFSPSAEAALQHLLSPTTRGFMAAAPAMRDAFDDLRAHQFGFVAGMRAALAGVLDRFDPAQLEGKLTQKSSGLMSILPGSRKARMWEVFTEHYAQISTEAEDDFHSLFGKAFLQAYEEHIDQLKRGPAS